MYVRHRSSVGRCHACGHRHFRINVIAVAAVAAVLLLATVIGVGEVAWMRHAQHDALPIAPAQAATSNGRLGLVTKSLSDFPVLSADIEQLRSKGKRPANPS